MAHHSHQSSHAEIPRYARNDMVGMRNVAGRGGTITAHRSSKPEHPKAWIPASAEMTKTS